MQFWAGYTKPPVFQQPLKWWSKKHPQTHQNILQCVCPYTGFVGVTNISFAFLNASTGRFWLLQTLMFPPSSLALFICTYVTDNFSSFLPSLHPFFNSAHGSIRHHGTVWSLSDFSHNGCCDHVSMGIANHLLRRSWRYFQPPSHCCYKGTEARKRPRNLSCSGAWKELLQRRHLMDLSLDCKSRLLPPWLMKSCFEEKMRKQWKLWLLCWGQEGWREPRQKRSSQEPDLMAGKQIGLWQLRRKKFFLRQFSNGYKIRIIWTTVISL